MTLLADRLGYARLAAPVRFRQPWEQAASLRLRDGDVTVLADYDQHARITGGDPEQVLDAAASTYTRWSRLRGGRVPVARLCATPGWPRAPEMGSPRGPRSNPDRR